MDTLSRLIDLARPQASLDLRCLLTGGFDIDHAPMEAGIAPFHLVLDGECVIETAGGAQVALQAGDFMLFPRGAAHRVRDIGRATATAPLTLSHNGMLPLRRNDGRNDEGEAHAHLDLLCGRFVYAPGSSALLLNALPDPFHVSLGGVRTLGALQTVIALMRTEAEQRQPGALAIVTALSHALFAMALRVHGEQNASGAGVLALLADARLGASVQGMLSAPERPWTIAELGERAAMSRATYARHFNERAGMTVMDFLTQIRMTIACDLLLRTQRSAAEIGEAVGYQSEAAFGKAFQQSVGATPGRYRRQPQENDQKSG
ncbi:HTH-type transcriptional regulator MtrA [Paraburkholderia nemoris]|uniref:cupin domain-containing protein n=1 Tax=Paraburkholderia nemoris TaxID=2793076 RepID=UPI00190B358E|nr:MULTISPECIES: AraC family transcriptional regulator [Paraburkholderia]MBK5146958.1 AraC family transcriptional regulator [Burkholderia sp. R-69608]MBK3741044.1 AraC family transcriptional regulator [Paraburkholderia aspalathi]MBK3779441.1 AraC family transcriptional regulator [Paraburkholderia aspalathi]CAE6694284.1 HTH-type transcriptional regulator MtrA [Paraburkholderia nemoris]CAE6825231.1 HTH-type transcriptional regulator MtrA [Paraburkholderia nemoris]